MKYMAYLQDNLWSVDDSDIFLTLKYIHVMQVFNIYLFLSVYRANLTEKNQFLVRYIYEAWLVTHDISKN